MHNVILDLARTYVNCFGAVFLKFPPSIQYAPEKKTQEKTRLMTHDIKGTGTGAAVPTASRSQKG